MEILFVDSEDVGQKVSSMLTLAYLHRQDVQVLDTLEHDLEHDCTAKVKAT